MYDILNASNGETYIIGENEAGKAGDILEKIERIDVLSPAKVALASFIQAKENGNIGKKDCILLNVSGGGVQRLKDEKETKIVEPWVTDVKNNLVKRILASMM